MHHEHAHDRRSRIRHSRNIFQLRRTTGRQPHATVAAAVAAAEPQGACVAAVVAAVEACTSIGQQADNPMRQSMCVAAVAATFETSSSSVGQQTDSPMRQCMCVAAQVTCAAAVAAAVEASSSSVGQQAKQTDSPMRQSMCVAAVSTAQVTSSGGIGQQGTDKPAATCHRTYTVQQLWQYGIADRRSCTRTPTALPMLTTDRWQSKCRKQAPQHAHAKA
jgi:hypothetical protein